MKSAKLSRHLENTWKPHDYEVTRDWHLDVPMLQIFTGSYWIPPPLYTFHNLLYRALAWDLDEIVDVLALGCELRRRYPVALLNTLEPPILLGLLRREGLVP